MSPTRRRTRSAPPSQLADGAEEMTDRNFEITVVISSAYGRITWRSRLCCKALPPVVDRAQISGCGRRAIWLDHVRP
jgi:hypothetical protein